LKQTKLRKRRVVRYAILYFILFVVFLALIVGPIIAGPKLPTFDLSSQGGIISELVQPHGLNNNDTISSLTGSGGNVGGAGGPATVGGDTATATDAFPTAGARMLRVF
jgi:1,3-beta-glucan synthase